MHLVEAAWRLSQASYGSGGKAMRWAWRCSQAVQTEGGDLQPDGEEDDAVGSRMRMDQACICAQSSFVGNCNGR